jgi:O-antigen/teichoic acid export membrane protein
MNRSILKNTVALSLPNFLNPVISFALVLVISRYLGVEGLGRYSLVSSYTAIFGAVACLGLGSLIVREAARRPDEVHVLFVNSALLGTLASIATQAAMMGLVGVMGYDQELVYASLVMSFSLAVSTVIFYAEAVFRSVEKSEFIAFAYLVENALRVGICVLLALWGHGIVALFAAVLGTRLIALFMFAALYVKMLGRPRWEIRPEVWLLLAKQAPVFASIVIFSTIHLSVDQIMLSKLKSVEAVGVYSAADRLLVICRTLPLAFSAALLPFFAREYRAGASGLEELAASAVRYMLLGLLPTAVGTAILADQIVSLIYGEKFAAAAPVLMLHIFSVIPFSLAYVFAEILIATDNQRVDLAVNVVAGGLNVALNFLLIPRFAELGAAAASLLTIVVFHQLQYRYVKKRLFSMSFVKLGWKSACATVGMAAITYLLRDWNLMANVALSASAFAALVFALGVLTPREIAFIRGLVRK